MRKGLKTIVAPLALLGASIALALGAAEASLRVFPQLMPEEAQLRLHWREVHPGTVSRADPYLGFVYPPNYEGRFERDDGDFAFSYTTDEHGFRNPSPWPQRAEIVVLGDSMAFGYGVEDEETWSSLLGDQLQGTRIINLGLIGAAPQQYLRIFERFGQALRPSLVLLCLFPGNDLADAERFDKWLQAGSPGNYDEWRRNSSQDGEQSSILSQLKESYLANFLRYAGHALESRFSGATIELSDGARLQLAPTVYARNERLARPNHQSFRLVLDAVRLTQALAAENGSQLLILLVPTKEEVYLPLIGKEPPPATAPFAAQFDEDGLPYLDLTPHFQSAARAGEPLFFEVDGHPNAAGYRLMAEVVLDYLRDSSQRFDPAGVQEGSAPDVAPGRLSDSRQVGLGTIRPAFPLQLPNLVAKPRERLAPEMKAPPDL